MLPTCKFGPLGRLSVDTAKLHSLPRLSAFMSRALAPPPALCNYLSGITNWGPMLNDRIGDCTCATAGHMRMGWSAAAKGTPVAVADADILTAYEAVSGYNPATGANDSGAACVNVLDYWQTVGIAGNKIAGYVAIDPTNATEVMQAIYLFGGVYAGINLPKSAEDQTDAGQVWDLTWFSPILGGHAIPYLAYGQGGVTAVTWGKQQPASWRFVAHQTDELYAIIDTDFLDAAGKTPTGLDYAGLIAAMPLLSAA
jgi:hypothetical protein